VSPWLPPDREREISDLAEVVSESCGAAIEPLSVAHAHELTASFNDYGEAFDGMLEAMDGRFHIYCNTRGEANRSTPRTRFTLAHELGHFFIDEHREALLAGRVPSHPSHCDHRSARLVEVEADTFASGLLMPWSRYLPAARRSKSGLGGVVELASTFRVSLTAAALRYVRADFIPCVLVKWGTAGYEWKWCSESAYRCGLRKTIESVEHLPRDCPTAKALGGITGVLEAGTTKSAWFPFVDRSWESNSIFHEQALSLGKFGALSLVFPD
jgi:hypothetical protein